MMNEIVAVKFQSKYNPSEFTGREYSYFTAISLKEGDIVAVPTKNGDGIAKVVKVGINENEIGISINLLKTIEALAGDNITKEAAAEIIPAPAF